MIRKHTLLALLASTTLVPLCIILSIEPEVITYQQDFSKYEFPLGTDKKTLDSLLGQPTTMNNHLYYSPLDKGNLIGIIYSTKFDKNNKLIVQDVRVGCCPKTFIIEPIPAKDRFLNLFREYEIINSPGQMFLSRTKNAISLMDQFLKRKGFDPNNPE